MPGSGHSFTEAALTDGVMIDLGGLWTVCSTPIPASGLVRVEGGIVLRDLNRELHARGLAMANLGDIDRQTISGAISTATHGTGTRLQNISAQVAEVELVTGIRARSSRSVPTTPTAVPRSAPRASGSARSARSRP